MTFSSAGPLKDLPSGSTPDGSMGKEPSLSRQAPVGPPLPPPNLLALNALDAVVFRQTFVDEAEVGVEEIEDTAVLAQDRLEEQLGLADHGRAQLLVEVGKDLRIGGDIGQLPQREPLPRKILHQGGRLRILE